MMSEIIITPSSGCTHLGLGLSQALGAELHPILSREFPDGELYVRVPADAAGKIVVLLECAGHRPNAALIETVLSVKTLLRHGAREVILVMPYFPYARQDSEFNPGEAVSLREVSELIEWLGVSSLVTVDMHLHRVRSMGEIFKRIKVMNMTAMRELARFAVERYGSDFTVVAPDEEARQWAHLFAKEVGVPYTVLEKERRGDEAVRVKGALLEGGKVIIVDDIISTGSTIVATLEALKAGSAKEVIVACTHGVFVAGADAKILSSGAREILTSDTIPNPFSRVTVARVLAEGVKKVLEGG